MLGFNRLANMNYKKKVIRTSKSIVFTSAVALAAINAGASEDHTVVVEEALTFKQIVENELQSAQFARQIAEYNGFAAITTIVPIGTTIQIPDPYMQRRDFGQVVFAKGDVVHTQQELVVNPPASGAYIYKGDSFTTGEDGFVSLKFSSGSVVNVQPESRVSVRDIACVDEKVSCVIALNAEAGEIESQVTPRPDGQPPIKFTVTTPYLSAAVRGTSFYVNVDDRADRIGVTHGLVATNVAGAANDLPKGKGLLAEANVEPELVDLLEVPELLSGTEAIVFSTEDKIRWKSLQAASQYRLIIAEDDAFTKPLMSEDVTSSGYSITADLSVGEYYVSVAGIDNNEFVGLPSSVKFSFAEIVDRERPGLQVTRPDNRVVIAPIEYTGDIELLISNDFDNPTQERRWVGSLSEGLTLELDSSQDWVMQARKVFSPTSVSVYSYQYFLEASK